MKVTRNESLRRLAKRAVIGIETLPAAERAQLLDDVSLILPKEEAKAARDTAFALRQSLQLQQDFLSLLK